MLLLSSLELVASISSDAMSCCIESHVEPSCYLNRCSCQLPCSHGLISSPSSGLQCLGCDHKAMTPGCLRRFAVLWQPCTTALAAALKLHPDIAWPLILEALGSAHHQLLHGWRRSTGVHAWACMHSVGCTDFVGGPTPSMFPLLARCGWQPASLCFSFWGAPTEPVRMLYRLPSRIFLARELPSVKPEVEV